MRVISGGPHASFMYEQVLSNSEVDIIIIGEGEHTVVELARAVESGGDLQKVKGIAFKDNGRIFKTEKRPWIQDLDSIPFPSRKHFQVARYQSSEYWMDKSLRKMKKTHIVGSRGCPFGCQFCSTSYFWGRVSRKRSPKNVVDEIELLSSQGFKMIWFCDDILTLNQDWCVEICKEIVRRQLDIAWYASTRADCVSKNVLAWMKKSGCCFLSYGVESGSPLILETINKGMTVDQVIRAFDLTREVGIRVGMSLMVGNPNESDRTIKETISLIARTKPDAVEASLTQIYPNTPLYRLAKEKGMIDDDFWLTEGPAPPYDAELTLETLNAFLFKVLDSHLRNMSIAKRLRFMGAHARYGRRHILRAFCRYFAFKMRNALGP
jgi:radical SAM superfamily enzyme YgiQ (UPF0313 family)